jgi:hypothetical protein
MPQNMIAAVDPRRLSGATSAAIAITFGNAPPNPNPVNSRATNSISNDDACIVIRVNTPNITTAPISTGFLPNTSASQPPAIAPITRPILLADNA